MPTVPRILVADHPESFAAFRRALQAPFDLAQADSVERAKAALAETPTLVVCGCHFDEGRMYDLLRYLKASPALARVPFMAVRCTEGELLDDALYESVKIAVRALGGNSFVDLTRWQRRWGEAEAARRLTQLVQGLVQRAGEDTSGF